MVDPALLDNVEVPLGWTEYLYHVGCSRTMHSTLEAGLIVSGQDAKEGRQTVFFTALDPTSNEPHDEYQDLSRPRKVHYWSKCKVTQDFLYWISLRKAQAKGLTFWQARSHAVIFCDSVPLDRIEKVGEHQNLM